MPSCNIDIRNLSEMFDEDSLNTFISVYLDGSDPDFVTRRENTVIKLLNGEELRNFNKTIEMVKEFLDSGSGREKTPIAIFASEKHDLFEVISLEASRRLNKSFNKVVDNKLVVDSSPFIRYLAEYLDEYGEAYSLLLMSYEQAKVFSVSCGEVAKEKSISENILNRHKKGGWSQARFQRIRKGEIKAFFSEVEEFIAGYGEGLDSLILAGPGKAKTEFRNSLPSHLQEKVVGVIDISIDEENLLITESYDVISEFREGEKEGLIKQIRREILRDGLASYGVEETLKMAKNGQVDVLMVDRDYHKRGWKCENCQVVKIDRDGKGTQENCPICGDVVSEVDVIEEIIEFAGRTGSRIEFVDRDDLKDFGNIAALLRYVN